MADTTTTLNLNIDTGNSINTINQLEKKLKDLKKEFKSTEIGSDKFNDLSKEIKDTDKELKDLNKTINKTADATEDVGKKGKTGFKSVSTGIKGVGVAIKAAGIGILLSVMTALFSLLKQNQAVMDFINKATKTMAILFNDLTSKVEPLRNVLVAAFEDPQTALKNLWEAIKTNLLNRLTGIVDSFKFLGKTIQSALELDWDGVKEGAAGLGESLLQVTTGVDDLPNKMLKFGKAAVESLEAATVAADKFIEKENELIRAEIELGKFISGNALKLEQLKSVREDETASMDDRIRASEEMNELIAEEERRTIALQEEKIKLLQANVGLTNTSIEDEKELGKAIEELDRIRTAAQIRQTENLKFNNALTKQLNAESVEDTKETLSEEEKLYNEFYQKRNSTRLRWALEDAVTDQEVYDAKLAIEDARFEEEMMKAWGNYEQMAFLYEEHLRNKEQLEVDFNEKSKERDKLTAKEKADIAVAGLALMTTILSTISSMQDAQMQEELKAAEGNEKKQEQIRKKYGEKKKKMAIAQVIMDTAQAIIATWAGYASMSIAGTILAGIQTAAIAAMAAVQISNISKQKFAQGGMLQGPSHAQGGISTIVGELEGGEAVINKYAMSDPNLRNVASAVNVAGGGRDFSTGSGSISLSEDSMATIVNGINNKKVYVSEIDITETQERVAVIEDYATL